MFLVLYYIFKYFFLFLSVSSHLVGVFLMLLPLKKIIINWKNYIYIYIYAKLSSHILAVRDRVVVNMQGTEFTLAILKLVPSHHQELV